MELQPSTSRGKQQSLWELLGLFWQIGYIIAIPAVLFMFSGAWLDKKLGTLPVFVIVGMLLSMGVSMVAIWRIVRRTMGSADTPQDKTQK